MALDCEETRSRLESVLATEGVTVQQEGGAGNLFVKGKKLELGRLLRVGGSVNMFQVAESPRTEASISWWGEEGRLTGSRRRSNNSLVSIVIVVFFDFIVFIFVVVLFVITFIKVIRIKGTRAKPKHREG